LGVFDKFDPARLNFVWQERPQAVPDLVRLMPDRYHDLLDRGDLAEFLDVSDQYWTTLVGQDRFGVLTPQFLESNSTTCRRNETNHVSMVVASHRMSIARKDQLTSATKKFKEHV
jgi:hypothetical protein